jgi:hypothetical protein
MLTYLRTLCYQHIRSRLQIFSFSDFQTVQFTIRYCFTTVKHKVHEPENTVNINTRPAIRAQILNFQGGPPCNAGY